MKHLKLFLASLILWVTPPNLMARDRQLVLSVPSTKPVWVDQLPEREGWHYFVGQAERPAVDAARTAADEDARAEAGRVAGTELRSSYEEATSNASGAGAGAEDVKATLSTVALSEIHDFEIQSRYMEEWKGPQGFFVRSWSLGRVNDTGWADAVKISKEKLAELYGKREEALAELKAQLLHAETLLELARGRRASGLQAEAAAYLDEAKGVLGFAGSLTQVLGPAEKAEVAKLKETLEAELTGQDRQVLAFQDAIRSIAQAVQDSGAPCALARSAAFQDSPCGSSLGAWLAEQVEYELGKRLGEKLMPQQTFQRRLAKAALSLEGLETASAEKQIAVGVGSLLQLRYWIRSDGIELSMQLVRVRSGSALAFARAVLPKPTEELVPENLATALKALVDLGPEVSASTSAQGLAVKAWPERGESAAYREGEEIVYCVTSVEDAYVYLLHADSEGQVELFLPNHWRAQNYLKAGEVLRLGTQDDDYTFKATPPHGCDVLVALATRKPLKSLPKAGAGGFAELGASGGAVVSLLMDEFRALRPSERGLSRAVYTTVSKR